MDTAFIFYHIPKAAGSSIYRRLEVLIKDKFYPAYDINQLMNLRHMYTAGKNIAVCGHAAWGVHEYLQEKFEINCFTTLREPWSLFLSFYRYEIALYKDVEEIDTYFRCYDHNMLIKYLGDGDSAVAEDLLFSFFTCYGHIEELQISQMHFHAKMGLDLGVVERQNVGILLEIEMPEWLKTNFLEKNEADVNFYQKAKKIFMEQTAHYRFYEGGKKGGYNWLPKKNRKPSQSSGDQFLKLQIRILSDSWMRKQYIGET